MFAWAAVSKAIEKMVMFWPCVSHKSYIGCWAMLRLLQVLLWLFKMKIFYFFFLMKTIRAFFVDIDLLSLSVIAAVRRCIVLYIASPSCLRLYLQFFCRLTGLFFMVSSSPTLQITVQVALCTVFSWYLVNDTSLLFGSEWYYTLWIKIYHPLTLPSPRPQDQNISRSIP